MKKLDDDSKMNNVIVVVNKLLIAYNPKKKTFKTMQLAQNYRNKQINVCSYIKQFFCLKFF